MSRINGSSSQRFCTHKDAFSAIMMTTASFDSAMTVADLIPDLMDRISYLKIVAKALDDEYEFDFGESNKEEACRQVEKRVVACFQCDDNVPNPAEGGADSK